MRSAVVVRDGQPSDLRPAVDLLGRAFQAEPVYEWVWPEPARRAAGLPPLLRSNLRHLHGGLDALTVATRDGRLVGAAIWDGPDRPGPGRWRRAAALAGRIRVVRAGLSRLVAVGRALAAVRPGEPHWYLDHLGADPLVPRCGAGTALLRSGLARADAAGVGTYLECRASNVDYYRRFGFRLRDEVVVEPGRLVVLTMWRPPAADR